MKVNKINVYYSATVQMRQFEPVVISASAEAQIDPGDTIGKVFKTVYQQIEDEVEDMIKIKKIRRKASADDDLEKSI